MSDVTGTIGQVLAGRYRLLALLGRGGMGSVWRAEHLSLGTPVAIKLVHPALAQRAGMLSRFLREAQSAARLRSANVVQILDHGVPYIAMECLEGESLAERLDREQKLGPAGTALILTGVCRALARAHRMGIVHRDRSSCSRTCSPTRSQRARWRCSSGAPRTRRGRAASAQAAAEAVVGHLGPHEVRCIGLIAMIKNKRAAGRTKDLADAEVLEELLARRAGRELRGGQVASAEQLSSHHRDSLSAEAHSIAY